MEIKTFDRVENFDCALNYLFLNKWESSFMILIDPEKNFNDCRIININREVALIQTVLEFEHNHEDKTLLLRLLFTHETLLKTAKPIIDSIFERLKQRSIEICKEFKNVTFCVEYVNDIRHRSFESVPRTEEWPDTINPTTDWVTMHMNSKVTFGKVNVSVTIIFFLDCCSTPPKKGKTLMKRVDGQVSIHTSATVGDFEDALKIRLIPQDCSIVKVECGSELFETSDNVSAMLSIPAMVIVTVTGNI